VEEEGTMMPAKKKPVRARDIRRAIREKKAAEAKKDA